MRKAEEGALEVCVTLPMLAELEEVLYYDRLQPRLQQLGVTPTQLVASAMSMVSIFDVPEGEPIVTADPDDDVFLHCAVAVGAACVVSGDRHLLDLGEHAGIPVLNVRSFFDRFFPD